MGLIKKKKNVKCCGNAEKKIGRCESVVNVQILGEISDDTVNDAQ